jgi:hypothetical protein
MRASDRSPTSTTLLKAYRSCHNRRSFPFPGLPPTPAESRKDEPLEGDDALATFMDGLHVTMLVAGVAALVGAACGPFVRLRDNTSHEAIVPIL